MTDEQYPYQDELNARRLQYEADDLREQLGYQREVLEALWEYIQFCMTNQNFDADLRKAMEALWEVACINACENVYDAINSSDCLDDFIAKINAQSGG